MNIGSLKNLVQPANLLPSMTVGLANAVFISSVRISYAALIFSGVLRQFLPQGIEMILMGTLAICVVIALASSLEGMIGVPQDIPAALMALVAAGIASALKDQSPEVIYSTAVGAIMLFSCLTAVLFIAMGWFKVSSFVRYVPYPVVGGFLAGSGYLLAKGALGIMAEIPITRENLPLLFAAHELRLWLPGVVFGSLLYLILRRYNHFLIMPAAVVTGIGLFYAFLFLAEISIEQAGAAGWLLGTFPESGFLRPFTLENFSMIQWSAVFTHFDTFVTLFALSVISLLLNSSGLEVVFKKDIDLNRELIVAGGANLVGGFLGSIVGYQGLGLSVMAGRFGTRSRLTAVCAGLFSALPLLFGTKFISYLPKPVLGGMLFTLGLSLLGEWLLDSYKRLPRMDYVLIWIMLIVIQVSGFLQAMGAGIMIAALLFVVSYGSVSVIRTELSGASLHSQVGRSNQHKDILAEKGAQIHILRLQGYIFFGSIQRVLQNVRERMSAKKSQPLKYLVLDFKRVNRLDSSAVFGITRLKQLTDANNIPMTWTSLSEDVRKQLGDGSLLMTEDELFSIQPTLDHGAEWCENKLLAREMQELKSSAADALSYINNSFPGFTRVKEYMQQETIQAGEYFIRQGEASNDMFLIESGLVTVEFEMSDGEKTRLRSVQGGATVGEIAFYLGGLRSASVKAEEASIVYRLTTSAMREMQKKDPDLAILLHEWLGHLLAERLADNNRMIELFTQ
jgi:SulP family sulfate permease